MTIPAITSVELYNLLQESGTSRVVFDVRNKEENDTGFIRNSQHLAFENDPKESADLSNYHCHKYIWEGNQCTKKVSNDWKTRKLFSILVFYDSEGKADGNF